MQRQSFASKLSIVCPPLVSFLLAAFFGWAFYERYWKWRDCIAEALSSCVTPDGDNLTDGGAFWALPACAFFVLGIFLLRRVARLR